mgnify:FL=1
MEADSHVDDYDSCRWQTNLVTDFRKNQQPGDPAKLAKVILIVAESENPPLHLAIGEDAPEVLDAYCKKIRADSDAWKIIASKASL